MSHPLFPQEESTGFLAQVAEALSPELFMSWEFWTTLTVILLLGEVLTAGFLLGSFVPGTIVAAVLAVIGWSFEAQLWGFVGGTLVGLVFIRPYMVKRFQSEGEPSNVNALIGQKVVVTEAIGENLPGRVKVRSEEWRATASGPLETGSLAKVLKVEGNTLHVESAS
jgi:membrane protein implicated in regulation of membrane protease activity